MALFRVDYSGRGELSERQQKLNQMLKRLSGLSEEFNVAVFVTNQVTSTHHYGRSRLTFKGTIRSRCFNDVCRKRQKACRGTYPGSRVNSPALSLSRKASSGQRTDAGQFIVSSATRIYLRKGRAEERVAKLQDSPDCPEKEASYQISEGGITDLGV